MSRRRHPLRARSPCEFANRIFLRLYLAELEKHAGLGITDMMIRCLWPRMEFEHGLAALRLFGQEVLPNARAFGAAPPVRAAVTRLDSPHDARARGR